MIVNTHRLFNNLLSSLRASVVCDVGSMNGADALAFRAASPDSAIYAFEPNPRNFLEMQANRMLADRNIQLLPLAASDQDGEAEFFLVPADYARRDFRRGMSSLHRRESGEVLEPPLRVKATRLDTFLSGKCPPDARLALWIDTEGKAYEVIRGAAGIVDRVWLLHVEVETVPCIGVGQKLYRDVVELLHQLGFSEYATDQARSAEQFNVVFMRRGLPAAFRMRAQVALVHAWLRHLLMRLARKLCPACVRRYQAGRPRSFDP